VGTLTVRQTCFLVALFVATSVTFITLDGRRTFEPVKTGLYDLIQPITAGIAGLADGVGGESDLERELAQARRERDGLQAEVVRLQGLEAENEQLRAQLGVAGEHPEWETVNANVLAADPASQQKFVTIDRGSRDGIRMGMAVVAPNPAIEGGDGPATAFLVGLVTVVSETSARVTLVIDDSFSVGAELSESSAAGTLYGAWGQGGRCELRNVDAGVAVEEGQWVVTSGGATKTGGVPEGLIIGQVSGAAEGDRQGQQVSIPVLPYVAFDGLRVVTVIRTADAP
jgi:rod shape-determining protein MreC